MAKETVRTHVVMPRVLVVAVDELVGRRNRSKFLTEAVQDKLARLKLASVAKKAASSLANIDIPSWETSESAAEWVRSLRHADEQKLSRIPQET